MAITYLQVVAGFNVNFTKNFIFLVMRWWLFFRKGAVLSKCLSLDFFVAFSPSKAISVRTTIIKWGQILWEDTAVSQKKFPVFFYHCIFLRHFPLSLEACITGKWSVKQSDSMIFAIAHVWAVFLTTFVYVYLMLVWQLLVFSRCSYYVYLLLLLSWTHSRTHQCLFSCVNNCEIVCLYHTSL